MTVLAPHLRIALRFVPGRIAPFKRNQSSCCRPASSPSLHSLVSLIMSLRILTSHLFVRPAVRETRKRCLSFSFAGPRQLDEVLKKDLLADKSGTEIADTWFSYHDSKVRLSNFK
jgi:hypothetical protein